MSLRELDHRQGDGFEVSLLWAPDTNQLAVLVLERSGEQFALEVEPNEAMEVFHHPYAYAHSRSHAFHRRRVAPQAA
jgi:hypothetical protein